LTVYNHLLVMKPPFQLCMLAPFITGDMYIL